MGQYGYAGNETASGRKGMNQMKGRGAKKGGYMSELRISGLRISVHCSTD